MVGMSWTHWTDVKRELIRYWELVVEVQSSKQIVSKGLALN